MGAVAWGYVFFGLTDLLVIFIDPGFYAVFLLETGWGLLFLVLVAVPLIAVVIRPRSPVLLVQVLAVAAGVAVAAVITPAVVAAVPSGGSDRDSRARRTPGAAGIHAGPGRGNAVG